MLPEELEQDVMKPLVQSFPPPISWPDTCEQQHQWHSPPIRVASESTTIISYLKYPLRDLLGMFLHR